MFAMGYDFLTMKFDDRDKLSHGWTGIAAYKNIGAKNEGRYRNNYFWHVGNHWSNIKFYEKPKPEVLVKLFNYFSPRYEAVSYLKDLPILSCSLISTDYGNHNLSTDSIIINDTDLKQIPDFCEQLLKDANESQFRKGEKINEIFLSYSLAGSETLLGIFTRVSKSFLEKEDVLQIVKEKISSADIAARDAADNFDRHYQAHKNYIDTLEWSPC